LKGYNIKFTIRKGKGKMMRVDDSFYDEIVKFSRKNQITLIDATRDLTDILKRNKNSKKKKKEIWRIMRDVEM